MQVQTLFGACFIQTSYKNNLYFFKTIVENGMYCLLHVIKGFLIVLLSVNDVVAIIYLLLFWVVLGLNSGSHIC
jgi:hypothetical protein